MERSGIRVFVPCNYACIPGFHFVTSGLRTLNHYALAVFFSDCDCDYNQRRFRKLFSPFTRLRITNARVYRITRALESARKDTTHFSDTDNNDGFFFILKDSRKTDKMPRIL